jgi:hypothetical protein
VKLLAKNRQQAEQGVALVIAIFTLMLISVVATALILMAGTESAMKGNYKSAMHAFYDAKAGLEEGRGRLWTGNPSSIANCVFPIAGQMMPTNRVCYIVNPSAGEVVNPLDLSAANPYADFEYQQEWQIPVTGATVQPFITSTSPIASANIAGPLYKWVRITPRTESSGNIDVDGKHTPNTLDNLNPLFFDGTQQLLSGGSPVAGAGQVLTITALAVTPYGSRRMVQYTVSSPMSSLALNFPAALVLTGGTPDANTYQAPSSNSFWLNGNDRQGLDKGNCALPPQAVKAIGLTGDPTPVIANIPNGRRDRYVGGNPPDPTPDVANIASALPLSEQSVNGLESVALTITNSATDIVPGPATGPATTLPNFGSMAGPVIEVVQGDLTINPAATTTGYGILLVTGKLSVGGSFGWRGIVLVIGEGNLNGNQSQSNEFDGAILVAKTRDKGNLLSSLGTPSVDWSGGTGNGMYYDSCWINNAAAASSYQVLSFREIPQLTP